MEGLRSELVMPLRARDGSVRAVLDVTSPRAARYGAAEISLLGTVAAALEGSITAAALYQDLGDRAARDPLTGLPNHRVFHERLEAEVARAARHGRALSVALLDIDHFTSVNDAHGHQAGDRVLVEVAARLGELTRSEDVVGRVGGEEFAIILPETDAMTAFGIAERARVSRSPPPPSPARATSPRRSASATSPTRRAPAELFRLADGALYWAKAHGRDVTYLYSPDVVRELSARGARRAARARPGPRRAARAGAGRGRQGPLHARALDPRRRPQPTPSPSGSAGAPTPRATCGAPGCCTTSARSACPTRSC